MFVNWIVNDNHERLMFNEMTVREYKIESSNYQATS